MSDTNTMMLPSNPEDRKKVRDAINEIVKSLTRIASEQDLIKETKGMLKEEYSMSPKIVGKAARMVFDQNRTKAEREQDDAGTLYELATGEIK